MTDQAASLLKGRAASCLFTLLLAISPGLAADIIRNAGEPMAVPFHCSDEDIAQGGLTCSEEAPCPVYVELTSVATVGSKIFVTGNFHSESATLYSLLLESDDAGESWTEPVARIQGAGLDSAQFPDFEHGWISGEMLQPLARDPFFCSTLRWRQSLAPPPVFEDGTGGSIQSFWFESATQGTMVVDKGGGRERYQLYESPTGGDTWTIRESNEKPIRIRSMPPAGSSGWRLRADAKSHSFHIEKITGESWKALASFLISAGSCKPAPEKDPEK